MGVSLGDWATPVQGWPSWSAYSRKPDFLGVYFLRRLASFSSLNYAFPVWPTTVVIFLAMFKFL